MLWVHFQYGSFRVALVSTAMIQLCAFNLPTSVPLQPMRFFSALPQHLLAFSRTCFQRVSALITAQKLRSFLVILDKPRGSRCQGAKLPITTIVRTFTDLRVLLRYGLI